MCGLTEYGEAVVGSLNTEYRKRTTIAVELAAKVYYSLSLFGYGSDPLSSLVYSCSWTSQRRDWIPRQLGRSWPSFGASLTMACPSSAPFTAETTPSLRSVVLQMVVSEFATHLCRAWCDECSEWCYTQWSLLGGGMPQLLDNSTRAEKQLRDSYAEVKSPSHSSTYFLSSV